MTPALSTRQIEPPVATQQNQPARFVPPMLNMAAMAGRGNALSWLGYL